MKATSALFALLLGVSISAQAIEDTKLISVEQYKKDLNQALKLYQSKNYNEALTALERIAQRGEKKAQYIVGVMYLNAQGSGQDLLKSYAWLKVANEQKNKKWLKPLTMLEEKLPKDYLSLAQQEADKYIAMYGVQEQKMKCQNAKTLGSRKGTHICKKMEVKKGFYSINL